MSEKTDSIRITEVIAESRMIIRGGDMQPREWLTPERTWTRCIFDAARFELWEMDKLQWWFRLARSRYLPQSEDTHTLYCIGGSLDGRIKWGFGNMLEHRVPVPTDIERQRYHHEFYERRSFQRSEAEPVVEFRVFTEMATLSAELHALARYVDAAVLRDEQVICE